MRFDLLALAVYIAGVAVFTPWIWRSMPDEMKHAVSETPFGPFKPGMITAAATALLWPVSVPLHVIGLVRAKLGWLTEYEKKRMK